MKRFIILAAVVVLVMARPETYKEQEDFQYSRSSSDEGTKSGYYGAQRGNTGGNYERAHNMDSLAQNQMSGLVRQVNGELGDGAKTKTGSVFSAANSRGTYGSGSFDLSNLGGRNFQDGISYDNSQSSSSLTHSSSAHQSAGYTNDQSHSYGGYQGYRKTASNGQLQTDNLQSLDNIQQNNRHNYDGSSGSSGYQTQTGYQQHRQYESGSDNSNSDSTQYIRWTPVRVVVRPGGRVAIPVSSQVYDITQGSSALNQNTLNSDVQSSSDLNQDSLSPKAKSYESSYRYNKKWEKHDTIPTTFVSVPSVIPIPKNSELNEDFDIHTYNNRKNANTGSLHNAHSSLTSGRYNTAHRNTQTQSQSNYNSQYTGDTANTNSPTTGYNSQDSSASLNAQHNSGSRYNGQVEDLNSQPKSYQSSYSYHKSWEHQGDPYVIKPATGYYDNQASQRLSSSTKNVGYTSYQPNNCDLNCHVRVARSYGTSNQELEQQSQNLDDDQQSLGQQSLSQFDNLKELSQQSQSNWDNLKDLGQLSQGNSDQQNIGQQTQNQRDKLDDLGQQSQSTWDQHNVGQQSQNPWDKLEDLGQQSQSTWDQHNVGQQPQIPLDKLEDLAQQSQSTWDQHNVGQQPQNPWDKLENLSQQSQSSLDQQNVGQQSQNQWDKLEDLGQQSQSTWDQHNVGQQSQSTWDQHNVGQHSQNPWDKLENISQQSQFTNVGQHSQNPWDKLENLSQQSQSSLDQQNVGQQSQNQWDKLENISQQSQSTNVDQHSQNQWDKLEDLNQQSQSNWDQQNIGQQSHNTWDKLEDITQSRQKLDKSHNYGQQAQNTANTKHDIENKKQNDPSAAISGRSSPLINEQGHHKKINAPRQYKKVNYTDFHIKKTMDSQSYKNLYSNHDIISHRKKPNNNMDYKYSKGFANSVFKRNYQNKISNNENRPVSSSNYKSNNWHSFYYNRRSNTYWHTFNNSQTNIQHIPLNNLWSNIALTFSKYKYNITRAKTTSISVENTTEIFKSKIATNSDFFNVDYKNPIHTKNVTKDFQTITYVQPETPQDVGRGDIGPEVSVDMDGIYNANNNTDRTLHSENSNSSKHANTQIIKFDQPRDHLSVLGLPQPKEENIVKSHAYTTMNVLTTSQLLNRLDNNTVSKNGIVMKQNYSTRHNDNKRELKNTTNYKQGSINLKQENLLKYGPDLQFVINQQDHVEQSDLINFHEMLLNFGHDHKINTENNKKIKDQQIFAEQHVYSDIIEQERNASRLFSVNMQQGQIVKYLNKINTENVTKNIEHNFFNKQILNLQHENNKLLQHHKPSKQENIHTQQKKIFKNVNKINTKENSHNIDHKFITEQNTQNENGNIEQKEIQLTKQENVNIQHEKIKLNNLNQTRVEKSVHIINSNVDLIQSLHNFAHALDPPLDTYYGVDDDIKLHSYEQDVSIYQDFNIQLRSKSTQKELIELITQSSSSLINSTTTEIQESVTAKPGFWQSLSDRIVDTKDKFVLWLINDLVT